jgi:uncharacterized protein (DUF58 family)
MDFFSSTAHSEASWRTADKLALGGSTHSSRDKTEDRGGWRAFAIAMLALAGAFGLAIYSGAASQNGALKTAAVAALAALALAGWVAVTLVPALARRTSLRWLAFEMNYRLTREGIVYLAAIGIVTLAALNTGNNLLFLVLGCLLAGMLISGILSRATLSGIELNLDLPGHVFAGDVAPAVVELRNLKQAVPSFGLRVTAIRPKKGEPAGNGPLLERPVYFPYLPRKQTVRNRVDLLFSRRGIYRQEQLAIRSRFPFGFLEKTRKMAARAEITVYPAIQPTETFYEILPLLSGELESYQRGRGHDLYAIRDFLSTDGTRFVDWKATAKSCVMKVREYAREDERRVLLAIDPYLSTAGAATGQKSPEAMAGQFEKAVSFCACLAWHFREIDSVIGYRAPDGSVALAPAPANVYDVLGQLASIEPRFEDRGREFLSELAREPQVFKIVLTSQPCGSIPTALWNSAYLIFFDSL